MRILIVTGIYPPKIGGPAQYAKNLKEEFDRQGHRVRVLTYTIEDRLPTGIRHLIFFLRVVFALRSVDFILALDTFSVGFPAVLAAKLFQKKIIIRTGGDFLWEGYVERTRDLVLFREFYETRREKLNTKEQIIFKLSKWTLRNVSALVFNTSWQRDIFTKAYSLDSNRNFVIENYYGPKISEFAPKEKNFISGTRPLRWKNREILREAFALAQKENPVILLDEASLPYDEFLQKIARSYAVILVSLGDIGPNMILDAMRSNTPFIVSRENGLMERIKDIGLFVDPESVDDIARKIIYLADDKNYQQQVEKVRRFTFTHGWNEIATEFINIYKQSCM